MLEFDQQNIFVKIPFERSISWFQNNKKTKKIHVSFKDEMWPQNKNAEWQLHNKMMDNSAPILDQLFWPYLCFAEQLQSLVILMMFRWQNDWWHHLSQTRLDSWNSCICPTKMAQEPTMIFTSRLNYTTVVACNLSKWVQQVWNLTDAGRQTWVADECQYWQRHLSSWCYGKTWLGKMTEVSQLRVIFWFNSHHC